MLKRYEREMTEAGWEQVVPGVEVKQVVAPEGQEETFILCRSEGRQEKGRAILNRFVERLEKALNKLVLQAEQGKVKNRQKVLLRIGRLLERYARAAGLFEVTVEECGSGKVSRLKIQVQKNEQRYAWALNTSGSYLLRTNWTEGTLSEFWKTYMQLTQAEDAFRITQSDLSIRPIYHQRADRTCAHILVCFLALAMWRTLQAWMSGCGLGTAPRKLLEEMREVRSLDVLLPTRDKTIRLRVVSTAPKELRVLLQRLKLPLPNRPKIVENVVQTLASLKC